MIRSLGEVHQVPQPKNMINVDELEKERLFKFDIYQIPEQLKIPLKEIETNKRKWKSLYMAVWGLPIHYLDPLINNGNGDKVLTLGLPASKYKFVKYTPKELKSYLTDYDGDIHINQIIKIFTLLENYFFIYNEIIEKKPNKIKRRWLYNKFNNLFEKLFPQKNTTIDFTKFKQLKKYLEENKFVSKKELLELELAKETRNCFVHRRGIIDGKWLNIYKKTQRKNNYKLNDKCPTLFTDLENWTDIFIDIIEKSLKYFKN